MLSEGCLRKHVIAGAAGVLVSVSGRVHFLKNEPDPIRLCGPSRTAWHIQYDQICRGLVLAGLVTTAPRIVLLKNKPVTTDL